MTARHPSHNKSKPVPPVEALFVYHGTDIDNLGSILRDGAIKPSITKLKQSNEPVVYLSFSFTKASDYGDVIFEIPYSRLVGNINVRTNWEELTTDEPVPIRLRDVMIFDSDRKYKELS